MQELINVYKERGNDFINDLFGSYVVVIEKLSGSSFAFEKTEQGLQYFKGNSENPINLIDRTLMVYYEPAIKYITDKTKSILSSIPDNWRFCFQYFVHNEPGVIRYDKLPKNNLVLTHIQIMSLGGKIAKVIDDYRVINDWSNKLDVMSLQPVFQGRLSDTQKKQIKNFLDIPIEDQMETFGTYSFSSYILSILNPSIGSTLLQDDSFKPIDSFVFKFYKPGEDKAFSAKLVDPYTKTLMRNRVKEDPRRAPADMNEIILLDILSFIEERGLRKSEILSTRSDERYLELVTSIFNDYVDRRGSDLKNLGIEKADFIKSGEFNLNLDMIANERAKERLSKDESLRDLYKIMIGSLRKKRDPDKPGVILTPSVIEDFNKMITKIEKIVYMKTDERFKTFGDYLKMKQMNESIFSEEDLNVEILSNINERNRVKGSLIDVDSLPDSIKDAAVKAGKMPQLTSFFNNLPEGEGRDAMFNLLNQISNNQRDVDFFINNLWTKTGPTQDGKIDISPNEYKQGTLGYKIFELVPAGMGRGELLFAWRIKDSKIQGGSVNFDLMTPNGKFEVKDYRNKNVPIRLGVKGNASQFIFFRQLLETISLIEKMIGVDTLADKYQFNKSFTDTELLDLINKILERSSSIRSGTFSKTDQETFKSFYEKISNVEYTPSVYVKAIFRGPSGEPLEINIEPLNIEDVKKSNTITITRKTGDISTVDSILAEFRRLRYARNPIDLDKDLQDAVNTAVGDIPFVIFRKSGINITRDFVFSYVSAGGIYILERSLAEK